MTSLSGSFFSSLKQSQVLYKSERKQQTLYINTYMWKQENWYRRSYLQYRNSYADIEDKHMDTEGEQGWEDQIPLTPYRLILRLTHKYS